MSMLKFLSKWFKIYEDEIGLFMWSAILLFLIRSSGIIFNNFAETAFLKRFGVEYLPIVYMLNSITTFIIMGGIAGIMARLPGARLLSYLLLFCGGSVAGLRFLIPLGFNLLYPLLFILKAQYEILLGLLFWNLANDLFNTRQSKRLFPLITAGGVLGDIIGSFGTPILSKIITIDNLMLIYLGTTVLGAATVKGLGSHSPTILLDEKRIETAKKLKSRSGIIEELKKIIPLMKESTLVKILVLLTFLPNLIVPIMNYQFNFAVSQQFATEGGMITFFGYFRGFMNVISLFILLFVGRIYGRWGLPVVLMFHPFNYVLAFLAFLLRFDIFSAMYARMSTNIIRTTLNKPATAVLMGLFPESYRAVMRPFLRGTVVRIGLMVSSVLILISEKLFHPKYLSIVAIPLVSAWIITTFFLKKSYSKILLNLVSKDIIDLKAMNDTDVRHLFQDEKIQIQLIQSFLAARGERALWYADLLKSLGVKDFDTHILGALKHQNDNTRIGLLKLLSSNAGEPVAKTLIELSNSENPNLIVAVIKAVNRLDPEFSARFDRDVFMDSPYPELKAHALAGLYQQSPNKYRSTIHSWLGAKDINLRKPGVIAAGESGDNSFAVHLKQMMDSEENTPILSHLLKGLQKLKPIDMNALAMPYLSYPSEPVCMAALEAIEIIDDDLLRKVISIMGSSAENVFKLAKYKIETAPYHNTQLLVESLTIPNRRVRKGLFDLLESLDVKDLDIFRVSWNQIHAGYQSLADTISLEAFPENVSRNLLIDHLNQKMFLSTENVLRVLSVQDRSGQMKIIYRGIFSSDSRKRANAMEALDNIMDKRLFKVMSPLLEMSSPRESLKTGTKNFKLIGLDSEKGALISRLLSDEDWVSIVLTLGLIKDNKSEKIDNNIIQKLATSKHKLIRRWLRESSMKNQATGGKKEDGMKNEVTFSDKIMLLKNIDLFEGLSVGELAAIASVAEEIDCPAGERIIHEGSIGDTIYFIIKGEVSAIMDMGGSNEIEVNRIKTGEYFGEMALFDDIERSASILTEKASSFLTLHNQEFKELVREYPQIALKICKVLSGRIRKVHTIIKSLDSSNL
jgi:hypothetical protein